MNRAVVLAIVLAVACSHHGSDADFVEVLLGGAEIAGMAEVRGASQEGAGKMIKGTCAAES